MRYIQKRNKVIGDPGFQRWSSRVPGIRWLARKRAKEIFALSTGFTTTQTLVALVESGLLDALKRSPRDLDAIAKVTKLEPDAAYRLIRAGEAIDIAEEVKPGVWMLGEQGAALVNNDGARAMIQHHRVLYRDLAEPMDLLRAGRAEPTNLSKYWAYAASKQDPRDVTETDEYSQLMAASQHFVAEQVLDSMSFRGVTSMLDVGGGNGAFLRAIHKEHPDIRLGLFDLPSVVEKARVPLKRSASVNHFSVHPGNFFTDPIPEGFDMISLSRILHDHDDEPAQALLANIRKSLKPGKRLLIAEPMSGVKGARAMGDVYFGFYLWAMNSGRPRRPDEIKEMLKNAGFASAKQISTPQPVVTSVIVATA